MAKSLFEEIFLFEHHVVSKISVLTDMQTPKDNDNTNRTYMAYLPLVAACCPDLDESSIKRKTFCLITVMQQMFLRHDTVSKLMDIDLTKKENRRAWHTQILHEREVFIMKRIKAACITQTLCFEEISAGRK